MSTEDDRALSDQSAPKALDIRLRQLQSELNTAAPCTVVTVEDDRVSIRLDILREFNGQPADPVIVPDVAVVYPGGGAFRLSWPIEPGDTGIALICQRDMDRWLDGRAPELPATRRMHDVSDAVFLPGLAPTGTAPLPQQVALASGVTTLTIDDAGTFELTGPQATVLVTATGAVTVSGLLAALTLDASGAVRLGNAAGGLTIAPDGSVVLAGSGGAIGVGPGGAVTAGGGPDGTGDNLTDLLVELVAVLASTSVLPHTPGGAAAISSVAQLSALLLRFRTLVQ